MRRNHPGVQSTPTEGAAARTPDLDFLSAQTAREARDARLLRRAIAVAVVVHAILLWVQLPRLEGQAQVDAPKRQAFVVRPVRFRPPEPDPPTRLPERQVRRVPMPDPTPDDPEVLRPIEPETFELPEVGLVPLIVPDVAPEEPVVGPVPLTAAMERPVKVYAPHPTYTEIARRAGIRGTVVLTAVIDADGAVRDVEVVRGLPMGLSEAAVSAVERWRFEPARLDGRAIAVILDLTVTFGLR